MTVRLLLILLTGAVSLFGNALSHSLSFQGYTGVINTPNAQVMNQGDLTFQYNNQFDNHHRGYNYNRPPAGQDDYIFGSGLLPYFEMQGRLSNSQGYVRDLSANIKLQFPFKFQYLPNLAIGMQDVGGELNHYSNSYIVIDKTFWFLRASLGYGVSDHYIENRKRMDGVFGGVECKTFDWLYLLAEDDTREQRIGIRLEMPDTWSKWFKLNAMLAANVSDDYKESFGVNLTFPLYEDNSLPAPRETKKTASSGNAKISKDTIEPYRPPQRVKIPSLNSNSDALNRNEIQKVLARIGFENIDVASLGSTLYIAYENNVFLFNELDALGVVLGIANQSSTKYNRFIFEPKKSKTVFASIHGDLNKARNFFSRRDRLSENKFIKTLEFTSPIERTDLTKQISSANDSFLRPRLELSPVVQTFAGTEVGVFDYMLWLRGNLYFNLYKGIDFSIVGDAAIAHSENFDPTYGNWRFYYNDSHIESIMLHNSDNFLGSINTISAGSFEENFIGVMDQWIHTHGNHTFKLKGGYFEQFQEGNSEEEFWFGKHEYRTIYLAKYSYLLKNYDILGEIRGGQYWNQDKGFDITLKRFFGDVSVSVFFEQSSGSNKLHSEQIDRFAGLGIELPLTLKRTPVYKYGQLRGTNAFSYAVQSTIMREDGSNRIITSGNVDPRVTIEVENYFLNRNRMQPDYIKTHLFRLLEAYDEYVADENIIPLATEYSKGHP